MTQSDSETTTAINLEEESNVNKNLKNGAGKHQDVIEIVESLDKQVNRVNLKIEKLQLAQERMETKLDDMLKQILKKWQRILDR